MTAIHTTTHLLCLHTTTTITTPPLPLPLPHHRHHPYNSHNSHNSHPPPKPPHCPFIRSILRSLHLTPKPKNSHPHNDEPEYFFSFFDYAYIPTPNRNTPQTRAEGFTPTWTSSRVSELCPKCLATFQKYNISAREARERVVEYRMLFDHYGGLTPKAFWNGDSGGRGEWMVLFMADDDDDAEKMGEGERERWWGEVDAVSDRGVGRGLLGVCRDLDKPLPALPPGEAGVVRGRGDVGKSLPGLPSRAEVRGVGNGEFERFRVARVVRERGVVDLNKALPEVPVDDVGIREGGWREFDFGWNFECEVRRELVKRDDVELGEELPLLSSTVYEAPKRG